MKKTKWVKLMSLLALVFAATMLFAACGGEKAAVQVVGTYSASGSNYAASGSTSRASVSSQTLTLFDDGTYSLVTTNTAITVSSGTVSATATLTVFGTYTVTAETAATEDEHSTKTITLGDITKSVWAFTGYDAVKGYIDTIFGNPELYPPNPNDWTAPYERYYGYRFPGNSDNFDAELKAEALAYFNVKTKELTVTDVTGQMSTAIAINVHGTAKLNNELKNTTF